MRSTDRLFHVFAEGRAAWSYEKINGYKHDAICKKSTKNIEMITRIEGSEKKKKIYDKSESTCNGMK